MQRKKNIPENLPEVHSLVCSKYDLTGVGMFPVIDPREAGFRVADIRTEDEIK